MGYSRLFTCCLFEVRCVAKAVDTSDRVGELVFEITASNDVPGLGQVLLQTQNRGTSLIINRPPP